MSRWHLQKSSRIFIELSVRCSKRPGYYLFLSILRSLSAVLGTSLFSVSDTGGIKGTTDDVVSGTGQVLNTTTTDQNNAVLLQIVTFTGNVAGNFDSVGKTYSGDLSKSRVRLFRSCCLNSGTYTTLLGSRNVCCFLVKRVVTLLESRCSRLLNRSLTSFSY